MKLAMLALAACLLVPCTVQAADRCLVGTWKARGNGAAEWMARHMHGIRLTMKVRSGMISLKPDGTYESGVRLDARAALTNGDSATTHGPVSTASKGRWRANGDDLVLEPRSEHVDGSIDFVTRFGRHLTHPMPAVGGGDRVMRMSYICQGNTLITRKTFPGIADPITQHYVRVR